MEQYRVKQLWLSGKGKKVYRSGDLVTENSFPEGNLAILLKEGRIERVSGEKAVEVEKPKTEAPEIGFENVVSPLFSFEKKGKQIDVFEEGDLTKNDIVDQLTSKGIEFDVADKKANLWALLVSNL
jgi:hypothetical protein